MVCNVEPLGKKGEDRAYQVTLEDDVGIILYNSNKDLFRCITCHRKCRHTALFEQYIETSNADFKWMREIAYTLTFHSRSKYNDLWMMITNGNIVRDKRHDKDRLISIINEKLRGMSFYEVGYLTLMGLPVELDEDYLEPVWGNAKEWVMSSGALEIYLNQDEFICNDDQNELLRKCMIEQESINT